MKKLTSLLLALVVAAGAVFAQPTAETYLDKDIVILYTNDVHCGLHTALGYDTLMAVKKDELAKTPYVALVDAGDSIQGEEIGTVSNGSYPVDIMNRMGYDYAALGNHEFDYGMARLGQLIDQAQYQYLACNITYSGTQGNLLAKVKPYAIKTYGDTKVAFVGVSTPESIAKSTPTYFMEDGTFVYDFGGDDPEAFYATVQKTVDQARAEGARYVVALTHLGVDESSEPFRSLDLIAHTSGIDVVLDGHSHSVIPCQVLANKDGKDVLLSQTGTKLQNIGKVLITPDGNITTSLISTYPRKDADMAAFVDQIEAKYRDALNQVIGQTSVDLTIADANGIRQVRNRETNLGDFCADAYRAVADADISLVNGGGVRAPIAKGPITYGALIKVHPYGNTLCMVEATGSQVLDALELASRATPKQQNDGSRALGEVGGFLQVSGLKYTIDTSIPSSVELDGRDMFVGVNGERRVKDVLVWQDGAWQPIDPDKTYKVASHNYLLKDAGDGFTMFQKDNLLINEGMLDNQVLMTYVTEDLGGTVPETYAEPQGRITIL